MQEMMGCLSPADGMRIAVKTCPFHAGPGGVRVEKRRD
jgi:hypothetical protein